VNTKTKSSVIASFLAIFLLAGLLLTCKGGGDDDPPQLPLLPGTITISPNTNVKTYTELTATYNGDEPVSYQWKQGETAISGATTDKYMPLMQEATPLP